MRKFALRARHGLYAVSLAPLFIAMAASAAVPSDVSPGVRAAMQRDLGLTSAQLSQYLGAEDLAATQGKALGKAQGAAFAGTWIERKPNGSFPVVVGTTAAGCAASSAHSATAFRFCWPCLEPWSPRRRQAGIPPTTPCRR